MKAYEKKLGLLKLGKLQVEDFRQIEGEDVWLGTLYLFGTAHHFQAVRVEKAYVESIQATADPHERLMEVWDIVGAKPETTTIPGLEGEFVIAVYPHGD